MSFMGCLIIVSIMRHGAKRWWKLTNRDRYIMTKNEYDRLCKVQASLLKGCQCVINALTGQINSCKNTNYEYCCECIREWLNKKER